MSLLLPLTAIAAGIVKILLTTKTYLHHRQQGVDAVDRHLLSFFYISSFFSDRLTVCFLRSSCPQDGDPVALFLICVVEVGNRYFLLPQMATINVALVATYCNSCWHSKNFVNDKNLFASSSTRRRCGRSASSQLFLHFVVFF